MNSKYNSFQERLPLLRFPLLASWHAPYLDLPHIATMGRDEILQPTRFKALKCNHPKKALSLVLK
ncbi:hypothetical protein [Helicobacter pylori]|uniref:hypothetical protein n=1 Tax=Helicobacter pylori TaxID=210 RepID=UPI001ABBA85C|nr:hypothetical protein [Helicobacter pylori]